MKKFIKKGIKIIILLNIIIIIFIIIFKICKDNNVNTSNINFSMNNQNNTLYQKYENIRKVSKSVVGISKMKNNKDIFLINDISNSFYGTGIIISSKGYILTNQHVAGNKNEINYITIDDGNKYISNVIWSNEDIDLGIRKINIDKEIEQVELGNSDLLNIGEEVYAIGNPIGVEFQKTVTSGIISGLNRMVEVKNEDNTKSYMENMIQTDASINKGNSGGPLINSNGQVIGINTIKISSAENIGFAVPINIIKGIIKKIDNNKNLDNIELGLFAYDKNIIEAIDSDIKLNEGIYIVEVKKNSLAEKIGIKNGDIIVKIDGININSMNDFREYLYNKYKGDIIKISMIRDNKIIDMFCKI